MTSKDTEVRKKLDAIEAIVGTLAGFEESDVNDIIAFARKHLGFSSAVMGTVDHAMGGHGAVDAPLPPTDNIARFVGEKHPQNDYQRVAVLGYFLYRVRGLTTFTLKDLTAANSEARQPSFSNISASVNKALTRYKYLSQGGQRGQYSISYPGEKLVEALPALESAPVIKGRKRTRKGKKTAKEE